MTEDEVRAVVREACLAVERTAVTAVRIEKLDAIVDRAVAQLSGLVGLSEEERSRALLMRSRAQGKVIEWEGWPTQKMYIEEVALLDRLLGGEP